ncbi:PREDICTED: uncharacterized protein LOC105563907 [Vollenhovia emeryi]|uniref:uncharacterized protein LOC105563907 n=1 Tax=Vollenhovia emeryi TaxID=411798 RepID=UPI0005F3733A|nr:PREDICTED: uncharacterized protein LOC105563907 [Vollenhovia emeryi]
MESDDEDMFAISDDETAMPAPAAPVNPVEEHLLQVLADVQNRIDVTASEVALRRANTACVLNALERRAVYAEDASSDSDRELYTAEGEPVIKRQRHSRTSSREKVLELISQWQCVLQNKWIIGVELVNRSCCTLLNPRYYPHMLPTRDEESFGESTFWKGERSLCTEKVHSIQPGAVVATLVLDLPMFDQGPVVKCLGLISYEINETQFQVPVPPIHLSIGETIDRSCIKFLDENDNGAILALKSTSAIERIVNVQFTSRQDDQTGFGNQLFRFFTAKIFIKIRDNVFWVKEHGSLMYCLVEIQSIDADKATIRIFARSVNQFNIILHLLQDEFSVVSVAEETDDCVEAAMALIRELEMIRENKSSHEIQEARMITDLLIP